MAQLEIIDRWEDLDEFARAIPAAHDGKLWPTLAISFVGSRPDLLVEAPLFVEEQADEITSHLVDFFGFLRPDRLAVFWPNFLQPESGEAFWAVRVNSAERHAGRWRWRTRVHPYLVDGGEVDLGPPFDLDDPPDPWSQRLRTLYLRRTQRRLERRGWFMIPDEPGWSVSAHPDSDTLDRYERVGLR